MQTTAFQYSLLNLSRFVKRVIVISSDVAICVLSVWLSFGLRVDRWRFFEGNEWWALVVAIGFSIPLFTAFGLYRAIFRYLGSSTIVSLVRAFFIYTLLYSIVFSFFGVPDVPRSFGLIQPILLFFGIGASRYCIITWLDRINHTQKSIHHVAPIALIYGAGSAGRQLAAAISLNKEILVKGFIDDDLHLQGNTINGIRVYGGESIKKLIIELEVTDILLAIPLANQAHRNAIIANLNGCGVRVRTLPGVLDMASGRVRISDLHDLDMNDLLGREVVPPNKFLLEKNILNQVVLVTGAGGSIGSELCRQIIMFSPKALILIDSSEHALYTVSEELKKSIALMADDGVERMAVDSSKLSSPAQEPIIKLVACLASVQDSSLMHKIFTEYQPKTVFHAAAYKHVPLVEANPAEGIRNNVYGTLNCAQAALETGVSNFILISTDKAVRPTNIMGASKRISELVLQAMADSANKEGSQIRFSMVRFGNVLGSSGSVAPLFSAQIKSGGPITLTHAAVTRYFMTIPEAAQLVIQSSAMSVGGDVFVLDMGQPIQIYDLAVRMIYLSGLMVKDDANPHGDIEILITGLRPGEKLYEELLLGNDPRETSHPKIMKAYEEYFPWEELEQELAKLNLALQAHDPKLIRKSIMLLVPGYQPSKDL